MRLTLQVAALLSVTLLAAAAPASAQDRRSVGPVLTLEEAITVASRNNPDHQQVRSNLRSAGAAVRSAYGALLPTADASMQAQYQQQGARPIQGVTFGTSADVYQSSYFIGLNYRLTAGKLIAPRLQSAALDAAEADIAGSEETLRGNVVQRFFNVLQSQARANLQDSLLVSTQVQLEMARARTAVGAGTQLDVTRAEVAHGQQRVAAIQARNQVEIDKLRLFQMMGVQLPLDVRLVADAGISPPTFALEYVLDLARQQNPGMQALRSRERVSHLNARAARSEYLPSLALSTGWGGYTYQVSNTDMLVDQARQQMLNNQASCFTTDSIRQGAGLPGITGQCSAIVFSDGMASSIRSDNSAFPFSFTRAPMQFTATLTVPLFDGFAREERVQRATAERNDARHRLRARELQIDADVTAAYLTMITQVRTVELQEQNAAKAREELRLAEERYRVGAASYLDLNDARASFERAEGDRITAIFEYHKAFAALESAVGRSLR
jgi:outer membrane protein